LPFRWSERSEAVAIDPVEDSIDLGLEALG
jgi:hypothetical protein